MDPAGAFFLEVLGFQLVLTAAVVALVARRFPRRAPVYRLVAPAAAPLMMLTMTIASYVMLMHALARPVEVAVVARLTLSYAVLWLVGVVFAGMVIRWARR